MLFVKGISCYIISSWNIRKTNFKLDNKMLPIFQNSFKKELLAGVSTFATMSYILIVNASILAEAGMNEGAVMVATIITTALATIMMGLISNLPIAVAPALSISPYFAYTVVQKHGFSFEQALAAIFIASLFLLILNVLNIRQKVVLSVPISLRDATTAGIGLFLVLIGLKHVGILQTNGFFITLDSVFTYGALFTLLGAAAIYFLLRFGISSAYIIVMLISWVVSLLMGLTNYQGIIGNIPAISPTLFKLDITALSSLSFWSIIFSFFMITLLDTGAALMSLCDLLGLCKKDKVPDFQPGFFCDATGSMIGSMLGTGSLSFHLESAAGIQAGGRTGLSAIITSLLFILCLFFYPLVRTIPDFASGAVIVVIGSIMFKHAFKICFCRSIEFIPSFLLIFFMGLTLSIYDGLTIGFLSYAALGFFTNKMQKIHPIFWTVCAIIFLHRILLIVS